MIGAGRPAKRRPIESIRPITREDLPRLLGKRSTMGLTPLKLRESHQLIAQMLSLGMDYQTIADQTGYSYSRVAILATTPAMRELVAGWREKLDESYVKHADAYYSLIFRNGMAAERHISDRIAELDDQGELLSVREALAISRDAADRVGYGKKQTNLNINADFAAMLEKAIERSGKQIEASPAPGLPRSAVAGPNPPRTLPRPSAIMRKLAS